MKIYFRICIKLIPVIFVSVLLMNNPLYPQTESDATGPAADANQELSPGDTEQKKSAEGKEEVLPGTGKLSDAVPESGAVKEDEGKNKLRPLVIKSERKKKKIQEISAHSMSARELKEVPSSFGDSVTALTALPGIIRAGGGIFGPLVIRGADLTSNRYFVDDIPIDDPLHFGGLHSVINTNMISGIDVYSSAFPAEFGSATAAIINISTVDEVEEFSGYADISIISTAALVQTPILRGKFGMISIDTPGSQKQDESESENAGYVICSGRYGNFELALKLVELLSGEDIPVTPRFWDYQFKSKYFFNKSNAASLLLFGHKDEFKLNFDESFREEGDDPLFTDFVMRSDKSSHGQGLYYDFKPGREFSNRAMIFGSEPESYSYMDFGAEGVASWARDLHVSSRPWIFGLKDKVMKKWLEGHAELRGGLEYTYYYFTSSGETILPAGVNPVFDISDESSFIKYGIDEKIKNHLYGGYIENKFTYYDLTVLPGYRSEYLARAETATYDPRMMASYRFPTKTTVAAAGGRYSYFFQINPFLFDGNPDICKLGKELKPEKANHMSLGVEQEMDLFTLKIEGFNNYFFDKAVAYPHYEADGRYVPGLCTGELKAFGAEIMIRKDLRENEDGLFGWFSYTYTDSKYRSGLPTQPGYAGVSENPVGDVYGDKWISSDFEQRHCLKLTAGYTFFQTHTVSGKFQFYSSFPYTPYESSIEDMDYAAAHQEEDLHRYIPVPGKTNSANFESTHQLDLRYTRKIHYSWGYLSWYVELINVYNYRAADNQRWYWNKPYAKGSNPKIEKQDGPAWMPNFGVELKF